MLCACKPSYLGDGDRKTESLRPVQEKLAKRYLNNNKKARGIA
jgi:hypothetical protein